MLKRLIHADNTYIHITYLLTYYLYTYSVTHLHTPLIRVIHEKLTGSQLVKKFPAFYGTWRFITAFSYIAPVSHKNFLYTHYI